MLYLPVFFLRLLLQIKVRLPFSFDALPVHVHDDALMHQLVNRQYIFVSFKTLDSSLRIDLVLVHSGRRSQCR